MNNIENISYTMKSSNLIDLNSSLNSQASSITSIQSTLNTKMYKEIQIIHNLPTTHCDPLFWHAGSQVPCGSLYIPTYSKGVYVDSGSDAIIIGVDSSTNIYVGFRNGTTWTGRKI